MASTESTTAITSTIAATTLMHLMLLQLWLFKVLPQYYRYA